MKRFWQQIDKLFQKTEKQGFESANKAHQWVINLLLLSVAYQMFTFFRPVRVRP
jgi:hypothetical protein